MKRTVCTPGNPDPRILIVDDNPAIHADFRKILLPPAASVELAAEEAILFEQVAMDRAPVLRVRIDSAHQGQDGIDLVRRAREAHEPYAVAFVDARMPPGLDGIETITGIWEQDPEVMVVLCTAYSDHCWADIRRRLPHADRLVVLKKPFDPIEILQLIDSLATRWQLARAERQRLWQWEQVQERNRRSDARKSAVAHTEVRSRRHIQIELGLREALAEGQLSLRYQPLVDIVTRSVVGLEALLRWQHPRLGWISPAEFIPVAEEFGAIVPIGEFVIRSALQQVVKWERNGIPVVPVAVNVSAVQMQSVGFWDRIREIALEVGAKPCHLAIELTESTLMENAARHAPALQRLRDDGVAIEIDDFGTGYSSLSCLKHLPLDTIKIDRSFVTHLGEDKTDEIILAAILTMAHSLGLRVVAEGVETPKQLEVLTRYGCEVAQGYYFCAPIPAAECADLLLDVSARPCLTDTMRLRRRPVSSVLHALSPKNLRRAGSM